MREDVAVTERLLDLCVDWDGWTMADGAEPRVSPTCGDLRDVAATIKALEAERENIAYHAHQAWTCIAQPTATEKQLATARHHINKIRAALDPLPSKEV
jgi:hypothetical protein